VTRHDGTRSRAIAERGRGHVDDHGGVAAGGRGQLFRDTGCIKQVDLFGRRHDCLAARDDASHLHHQLRRVWTKPGYTPNPRTAAVFTIIPTVVLPPVYLATTYDPGRRLSAGIACIGP
jgi:hypothetical protein